MNRKTVGILLICLLSLAGIKFEFAQEPGGNQDSLSVKSLVLTTDVVNRTPVDTVQSFSTADSEAFCLIRVRNSGAPSTLTFRWLRNNQEYFTFDAPIGRSGNWRTFSSITPRPGNWTVQILDAAGNILKQVNFIVSTQSGVPGN